MCPPEKNLVVSTVLANTNPNGNYKIYFIEEEFKQICEYGGSILLSTLSVSATGPLRSKCIAKLSESENMETYMEKLVQKGKIPLLIQLWKNGNKQIRSEARKKIIDIEFDSILYNISESTS